ncbi:MAG: M20/M25/M40 family metallo-hydrolase [Chloroflexi bacterium]|nr:M20/M25/M40 family metallo-hydrolase [Chloroflexota bacterium]
MTQTEIQQQVHAYLQTKLPDYLALLRRMVDINSFTANPTGVDELGRLTAAAFEALGFTAVFIPSANPDFGHHLLLNRPGQSGRQIGLVSHLDTVFPPDEEIRHHFAWREDGARIYGPGTVDIKGGTLIIYMMLDALQAITPAVYNDVTWTILLDASEETNGMDFGQLCIEQLGSALACLIFEGGYMENGRAKVVVARKGMATYHLEAEGKASHAGSAHEQGANAIVQMADVVQQVAAMTDYGRGLTFNPGVISGGTVTNRVPHQASLDVEMRAFDPAVYAAGVAGMLAWNGRSSRRSSDGYFACRVSVAVTRQTQPWPRNPATDHLFAIWQAAGEALGIRVEPEERGGLSDGNYFWHLIPSLDGLGASGGNAHCSEQSADGSKEQEYCTPAALVPKTLLNVTAVLLLLA